MAETRILLTAPQAAALLGLRPQTLASWRCEGRRDQPPYHRLGRSIRYDRDDLLRWLDQHAVGVEGGAA